MNILVTGCNGQLGNEIRLLAPHHPQHTFYFTDVAELDITQPDAIRAFIAANAIQLTINCAAFTAVDKAESQEALCDRLNHVAPGYLAEAMHRAGGTLIHVSTDYVFNGTAHVPYKETDEPCPDSVYGRTKLAGEQAVLAACPEAVIVRTAWLYSTFGGNFVKTMLRLGREKAELGVVADQIGTPTYARDLAVALLNIVSHGTVAGIYHYTNEGVTSWYDFARAIHREAGLTTCHVRPLHTEEYPTPARRPHFSVLDKSKIKQTYGIIVPWWEDSLRECIKKLASQG